VSRFKEPKEKILIRCGGISAEKSADMDVVREAAYSLGFVSIGVASAAVPPFYDELVHWLAEGKHGDMKWFEKNLHLRRDPAGLLKGCRAVVCLAYPYSRKKPCTPDGFCMSRYSEPLLDDYHVRLRSLAGEVAAVVRQRYPGSRSRVCVDSAPVMERSLAAEAGVGFIGKNTSLIVPGVGSCVYLAEILTTAPLVPTSPLPESAGSCGDCTRCLDACPTGALEAPYRLDAGKCLSYLTIEHKAPVNLGTGRLMGSCILGCDRCQEVCPYNAGMGSKEICLPSSTDFLIMDHAAFDSRFGRTALARAGIEKIKGNITAVLHGSMREAPGEKPILT
jgi:epoxyqueuosine reductase